MKKLLSLLFCLTLLASCNEDDNITNNETSIRITVLENGKPKPEEEINLHAEAIFTKTAITDNNGIATFNLQDSFDSNIINDKTSISFSIIKLGDINIIKNYIEVTVEEGQTKKIDIDI